MKGDQNKLNESDDFWNILKATENMQLNQQLQSSLDIFLRVLEYDFGV